MVQYVRIWQPVNIDNVKQHLVIVGDLTGDCATCREIGIKYVQARICPSCKTDFKFITCRDMSPHAARRIKERRPDLVFIDYEDYKRITGKQSARDLFG